MILELFAKPFPTERKPSKCPTKEKKQGKKSKRSREDRKRKVKDEGAGKLARKTTISKCCFLHMPELREL